MQAVQFTEHGDRAVIEYGDHPDTEPGRGGGRGPLRGV
jgi:NADPH2:quinone reductase